jgi:uncharacterized protein YjbJ (UPF0337 family)
MDWNRVEGSWKQFRGRVKEKWGDLTDDDLDKVGGRRDHLEGTITNVTVSRRIKREKTSTSG